MTDNRPPQKGGQIPRQGPQRRIAPTNISTTPQNSRHRLSISHSSQTHLEEAEEDAADEEDDDQLPASIENARPREDRALSRLSHSFFERRSNDDGAEELTIPAVEDTPSRRHIHLIPRLIRPDRYFDLVYLPGHDFFDSDLQQLTETYELRWSAEHIEQFPGHQLRLRFEQEYPSLLRASYPIEMPESERHSRIFLRVVPKAMLETPGYLFSVVGSVT